MASNSILKLQVDDKQYEASLKSAQQGLQALMNALRNSGKSFSDLDKNTEQYVRALGNMEATAKTTRGRIGEMSSAFVELSQVEKQLTDQERQSPVGKALTESLGQLKQRTIEAKQELEDLDKQLTSPKAPATTGGMFSGIGSKMEGALAVFGGNLMTKASEAIVQLGSEMYGMVQQGIELARQGEGVRIAFERLGRGDILDGLREATHGTVTDLELMKAAVKFNDFKLPVEELGTMLAFAQQKAKDTGQSVDYMVDSIVTGLGRKSLMILDNLGLSASDIRNKMKETGDMTKAVGAIIREQMASAGEYVETAADRAAQANVNLQNKMEELGRKFGPVEEASNQLWTSIKIGILDIIGGPLATLLNQLTEAGRLKNALNDINGDGSNGTETRSGKALRILREYSGGGKGIEGKRELYNRQVASFQNQEEKEWRKANRLRDELAGLRKQQRENGASGNLSPLIQETSRQLEEAVNRAKAFRIARNEYVKGAQDIIKPVNVNVNTKQAEQNVASLRKQLKELEQQRKKAVKAGDQEQVENLTKQISQVKTNIGYLDPKANKTGSSSKTEQTQLQKNQAEIAKLTQEYVKLGDVETEASRKHQAEIQKEIERLQKLNGLLALRAEQAQGRLLPTNIQTGGLSNTPGTLLKTPDTAIPSGGLQLDDKAMKAVQKNIDKQMKDVGKIGDEWSGVASAIGAVGNAMQQIEDPAAKVAGTIAQAIATIALSYAQAMAIAATTTGPWGWIAFAATGLSTMISTISAIHSATGYAEGGMIKGNSYSGDNLMAMGPNGLIGLNAGEIVLNKSQQNNLASQLQGGGMQNLNLTATIKGEQIRLALNNNGRRTGRGEYVQSRNVR